MPTTTTTYALQKPTVGGDSDVWGGYLNDNADKLDDVLDGTLPITPAAGNDIDIVGTNAATNTVTTLLTLNSQSTGTPAAGIGSALAFAAETAAGNTEVGAVIEAVTTDVTSTSEDFDLVIKTMAAGATAAERLRVSSATTTVTGTLSATTALTSAAVTGSSSVTTPSLTNAGTLALSATGANIITASTNGTERFRVGSSGELGIAGANFGSSGQALISGGSGAAPSWGSSVVLGSSVASTSGTSIDFTSIPSWVRRLVVFFDGVSTNGTSVIQIQLGSGSVQTSGYNSQGIFVPASASNSAATYTTGFGTVQNNAASVRRGLITFSLYGSNTWVAMGLISDTVGAGSLTSVGGSVALGGALDRVRITTVNGTDTFDAGTINISWE